MKNKKILFLAATLLLGAGSLASCGGTRNFTVWGAKGDQEYLAQVIQNFKAANPEYADVVIDLGVMAEPDAPAALKTDLKKSADVFHFAGDQLGELVTSKYLYSIPNSMTNNIGIESGVLDAGKVNGAQYGIPFTPNTYFLYYDASVYSAQDVLSLDAMMAKTMPSKYQYNFCFDVGNGWYQQSLFFSNGCTIFGENGNDASKGIEPRDKGLQAAQVMFNMNKDSKIQTGDAQPAVGITAAAGVTGTWAAADIKAAITAKGGTYACTVLPKLTFGTEQKTWQSVRDFKHVGVNAVTKNPELACKLAAFIANKDSQLLRYTLKTTAPTNSETLADPSITWDEAIIAQSQQTGSLSNTFLQPTIYGNQNYWNLSGSFNSDLVAAKEAEIADYFDAFNDQLTTAE